MHELNQPGRCITPTGSTTSYGESQLVEALSKHLPEVEQPEIEEFIAQLYDAFEEKVFEERHGVGATGEDEALRYIELTTNVVPIDVESTADTVIRAMQFLQKQVLIKDAVNKVLKQELDARTEALVRNEESMRQLIAAQEGSGLANGLTLPDDIALVSAAA